MWQDDPLKVWNPRRPCKTCRPCPDCRTWGRRQRRREVCQACQNKERQRKRGPRWIPTDLCPVCHNTQLMPMDLAGHWAPSPAFLICGGASLQEYPMERLRERGVLSLGINNAAAYAPCSAFTFGDGQEKFHTSLFADGKCMAFVPNGKLGKRPRIRLKDGFHYLDKPVGEFPNVYGYARRPTFCAESFLTDWWAQWGWSKDKKRREFDCWEEDTEDTPYHMITSALLGFRLLHYLGCPRVYLLGIDHVITNEMPYAWKGNKTKGNSRWWKEDAYFRGIRPVLEAAGMQVWNVNPWSRVKAFEHKTWDEAITDCKGWIEDEPFDIGGANWYSKKQKMADIKQFPEFLPAWPDSR